LAQSTEDFCDSIVFILASRLSYLMQCIILILFTYLKIKSGVLVMSYCWRFGWSGKRNSRQKNPDL